jgi:acyl-CoA hydrolase
MENYKLVLRGDLNQNGYLYGGNLLKWLDEYAWIAATIDYPDTNLVTLALNEVTFRKSIKEGSILKFSINKTRTGNTSVQYYVEIFCCTKCQKKMDLVFSTHITFVNLDKKGNKKRLPAI